MTVQPVTVCDAGYRSIRTRCWTASSSDADEPGLRRAGAGDPVRALVAEDRPSPRPDPTFVTHLIATADQAPQTRSLRRASLADAQTAYGASQIRRHGAGFRTRQII